MSFIYCILILIISSCWKLSAADSADEFSIALLRFYSIYKDVIRMIIIFFRKVVCPLFSSWQFLYQEISRWHNRAWLIQHRVIFSVHSACSGFLRNRREASRFYNRLLKPVKYHRDSYTVRNKVASVDKFFSFFTQFGAALDITSEQSAWFYMCYIVHLLNDCSWVPLPLPLGPKIKIFI